MLMSRNLHSEDKGALNIVQYHGEGHRVLSVSIQQEFPASIILFPIPTFTMAFQKQQFLKGKRDETVSCPPFSLHTSSFSWHSAQEKERYTILH